MDLKICLLFISYSLALPIEDFDPNEVFLGHEREMETLDKVGQGVDAGPSDVGHELHAKMEEAAEKALAIIQHATKYLDESAKEQSSSPKDSYKTKDYKSSDWNRREKREVESVPQTDSDAAKTRLTKRAILTDINFDEMNPDAVKGGATQKDDEVVSDTDLKWFDPDSPLTPNSVDKLIEAVNSLNDVFGKFVDQYDEVHHLIKPDQKDEEHEAEDDKVINENESDDENEGDDEEGDHEEAEDEDEAEEDEDDIEDDEDDNDEDEAEDEEDDEEDEEDAEVDDDEESQEDEGEEYTETENEDNEEADHVEPTEPKTVEDLDEEKSEEVAANETEETSSSKVDEDKSGSDEETGSYDPDNRDYAV